MKVKFWGVRGSIPSTNYSTDIKWKLEQILASAMNVPLADHRRVEEFIAGLPYHLIHPVGGNTSCVEVTEGPSRVILDAGSGLRQLGLEMAPEDSSFSETDLYQTMENGHGRDSRAEKPKAAPGQNITIMLSHTHWDHIQGFPFFAPAYGLDNRISIYGGNGDNLTAAFSLQQSAPEMFPIDLYDMGAELSFHTFPADGLTVGELRVESLPLPHPGGCLAYRVNSGDKSVVYATDYEFPDANDPRADRFIEFIAGADVLISDTQYTYLESVAREGWGHSTSFGAMDLAMRAEVGSFFLFHHDPEHNDAKLFDNLDKTRAYHVMMSDKGSMRIELASEGLSINL